MVITGYPSNSISPLYCKNKNKTKQAKKTPSVIAVMCCVRALVGCHGEKGGGGENQVESESGFGIGLHFAFSQF